MPPPSIQHLDSVVLYVSDLAASKHFFVEILGLTLLREDEIAAIVALGRARLVLHRNDRGHADQLWPFGDAIGGAALRLNVTDPDEWEDHLRRAGAPVLGPARDAAWGRFVLTADPDGRPIALAAMRV